MKLINANNKKEYLFIDELRKRAAEVDSSVIKVVTEIIERIKKEGDKALIDYTKRYDKTDKIQKFGKEDFRVAYDRADDNFKRALNAAAKNIREFHKKQIKKGYEINNNGALTGQVVKGLDCVGIYVPGGTAAYPSSVLMNAIPAKLANVIRVIMISPPPKNGVVNQDILTAAYIAGVDELILIGGAQGIAALAYGTQSVPRVDKIVGPGNIYVATAKRLVYGACDIDMVAGPSEILIVADKTANPLYIAADMLSQAEHDTLASSILITTCQSVAERTVKELENLTATSKRAEIIRKSLNDFGGIIITESLEKAFELTNICAPEHLEILTDNPMQYLEKVRNAGSVFLGEYSPEPLGDYYAGANHVLPTGGTARFYSPLSVDSFIKRIQYVYYTKDALQKASGDIITIAEREGLFAHAESIKVRLK